MHIKQFFTIAIATAVGLVEAQTLRQAIAEREELSTLLELLDARPKFAANLAALEGITVFAPANDARSFSADRYDGGGWPISFENEITYHILDGWSVGSDQITEDEVFYPTLSLPAGLPTRIEPGINRTNAWGTRLGVSLVDGTAVLNSDGVSTNVVTADIEYDNGIIHIVDALLFKPANLINALLSPERASWIFSRAITNVAGLAEDLEGPNYNPFTVFAPSLAAFEALGASLSEGNVGDLVPGETLSSLSEEQFARIVEYHIVGGGLPFFSYDLFDGQELPVLSFNVSGSLTVTTDDDGTVWVNQARVLSTDILHENGVIHIIDSVLNPDQQDLSPSESDEPVVAEFETEAPSDYILPASRTEIEIVVTAMETATAVFSTVAPTTAPAWTATSAPSSEPTSEPDTDESTSDPDTDESTSDPDTDESESEEYTGAGQVVESCPFLLALGACAVAFAVLI